MIDIQQAFKNLAFLAQRSYSHGYDTSEEIVACMLEFNVIHMTDSMAAAKLADETYVVAGIEALEYAWIYDENPFPNFSGFSREHKRLLFQCVMTACQKLRDAGE